MIPSQTFADFFLSHKIGDVKKELNLLVDIGLSTDNGNFDYSDERDRLIFLRDGLFNILDAANTLAEKQHSRFLQKANLQVREDGAI